MKIEDLIIDIEQTCEINGSIESVFRSALYRLGEGNLHENGESMQMFLEEFAGGRWYRDRGEGIQHLWGHVQVIKPPVLIEISGPLFMSYPAINHLELKFNDEGGQTRVTLRHRAFGTIVPEHREGVTRGWKALLETIKQDFKESVA